MTQETQPTKHKLLLVDDDPDDLNLYAKLLCGLPSKPEISTASSGGRAIAMLESEPFRLLICDLRMPKMDGLQVLSIVRRKYPEMRTVALTSVGDEQFRSRVYALGVDLFWHKPSTEQETALFLECLEAMLDRESDGGFRGLQSKSLVDIVQLECLSQSSSVLRITNGRLAGKIWIQDGQVIDAEEGELQGERAFQRILSWRAGTFDSLPPDPSRPRTIFKSYNGLLLESAQALDETQNLSADQAGARSLASPLAHLSQVEGLEFALAMKRGSAGQPAARGIESPERMAGWARQTLENFQALGEMLNAGPLEHLEGLGPQRHVSLGRQGDTDLCVGWVHSATIDTIRQQMGKVLGLWTS